MITLIWPYCVTHVFQIGSELRVSGFSLHGGGHGPRAPFIRGIHSSTFRLDVSTLCGICWVVSVRKAAQVELRSGRVEPPYTRPLFGST